MLNTFRTYRWKMKNREYLGISLFGKFLTPKIWFISTSVSSFNFLAHTVYRRKFAYSPKLEEFVSSFEKVSTDFSIFLDLIEDFKNLVSWLGFLSIYHWIGFTHKLWGDWEKLLSPEQRCHWFMLFPRIHSDLKWNPTSIKDKCRYSGGVNIPIVNQEKGSATKSEVLWIFFFYVRRVVSPLLWNKPEAMKQPFWHNKNNS